MGILSTNVSYRNSTNSFVTVAAINLIYQFWVHTEHIGRLGVLEYIFITPSNHRIHHAQNDDYLDANYGGVFIIWDRILELL